jgi:hypothetical protein
VKSWGCTVLEAFEAIEDNAALNRGIWPAPWKKQLCPCDSEANAI